MFLSVKFLRIFFIVFSIISGLLSSRVLRIWFFLELSTISFFINLIFVKHKAMYKETMKLFLIQSLRGIRILLILLISERSTSLGINFLIWLVILFKIRAVPFHSWFLSLRNIISWERVILFLTIIKFIPLMILSNCRRPSSTFFRIIAFIVARIRRLFYSRIKKLIVLSSLYFLGILFFSINLTNVWLEIILVYRLMFLPLFFVFRNRNTILFFESWINGLSTLILFLIIIRLAGLPPFPGFFLKYFWLLELKIDFWSLIIFFLRSRLIMYLYIRFTIKNLLEVSNQVWVPAGSLKINFFLLWFFTAPAFISIYFCF